MQVTLQNVEERTVSFPMCLLRFFFLCWSRLSEHAGLRLHLSLRVGREALEMVFAASLADFQSAVSFALFHIFVDMSVSAKVMLALESPPTTTGVMHTFIMQFLPLSDTILFTTRTNSALDTGASVCRVSFTHPSQSLLHTSALSQGIT